MTQENRSVLLSEAPEWFLAIAAFIYASGFLVVFTFFARLGIREAGTEFFKVKYIHVGILCLILPALTGLSMLALSYMATMEAQRRSEGQAADIKIYLPSAVLTLNLIVTFYIYAMFSPSGFFRTRSHLIPLIFAVTLIGLTVIQQFTREEFVLFIGRSADKVKRFSASADIIGSVLRWMLCLVVIFFLDRYSFRGLGADLWEMFSGNVRFAGGGGYVFLIFMLLLLWLLWRITNRSRAITDQKLKTALWASGLSVIFATLYICILSFAYSVYPYIPAERGGGSYVDSPRAVLTFESGSSVLASNLLASGSTTKPLLIIEETGTSIYVADPTGAGGPIEWRRGATPNVIEIRRKIVNSIEYRAPGDTK